MLKDYKGEGAIAAGEAFDPSPKNIESRTQRYTMPQSLQVSMLEKKTRGATVHAVIRLRFGKVENLRGLQTVGGLTGSLLMRGTARKNRQQIQDAIDQLKLRLSVNGTASGATASLETTRENLPGALRLAAEILKEASLPEAELEQIRKQRITGLEAGRNEPQVRAGMRISTALNRFPKDDVRAALTIDEQLERLKAVKLEEVKDFYKRFYGASQGEVAIVGDFDPAAVKKVLTEEFGSWKSPAPYALIISGYAPEKAINESIETPDKQNAILVAGMHLEMTDKHPDYPALVFGNFLLGGGFLNSRLATRIRVNEGLSYSISSGLFAGTLDNNAMFQASAIAAPQNITKVEASLKDEIARTLRDGFTAKEVDAGKSGWIQSQQVHRASDDALAGTLAQRAFQGRTLAWDEEFEAKVMALKAEDIAVAMRRHLKLENLSIVKAGDFAKAAKP